MATLYRPSNCIWQGCSTSTTGGTVTLGIAAAVGKLNFRDRYANGATGVPLELYDSTSGIYEFSYGTLTYGGGGPTTDTISSRVITYSTNGPGTPVAWGSSARDAFCMTAAESFLFAENAFAEMTNAQAAAGLVRLGGAPAGILGLTGGTDGRAVRYTSSNTMADAQNSDTADQLGDLLFKSGGVYYRPGDLVPGLSGLTAGQIYYLGTIAGTYLLTAAPTVSTILRVVRLGKALSTTTLLFKPSAPITR